MRALLIIVTGMLLLAGCGKKGALMPPEALVPATVPVLKASQQGSDLVVSWKAPSKEKGGRPLRDLAGFSLYRRTITGDGTDCAACAESWPLIRTIDLEKPADVVRSGGTFIFRDRNLPVGSTFQYRIVATSASGGFSAPVTSTAVKQRPPFPPPVLTVTPLPASISLAFTVLPAEKESLAGFNIYRRSDDSEQALLPVNAAPVTSAVWEDGLVSFGRKYRYSVSSLHRVDGDIVESLRSPETDVLFTLQELR